MKLDILVYVSNVSGLHVIISSLPTVTYFACNRTLELLTDFVYVLVEAVSSNQSLQTLITVVAVLHCLFVNMGSDGLLTNFVYAPVYNESSLCKLR